MTQPPLRRVSTPLQTFALILLLLTVASRPLSWDDWIVCSGWFHGFVTGDWSAPSTGRCAGGDLE